MATREARAVGFVLQMELKRRELGLGHGAWAAYLAMDRSLWYMLRTGRKELSIAVIQRVLREWPDEFQPFLLEAVLAWGDRPPEPEPGDRAVARVAC